jgi:hypothetical protein
MLGGGGIGAVLADPRFAGEQMREGGRSDRHIV